METQPLRAYGGIDGDQRQAHRRRQLIEAGLDLLGADGGEANLTVRGVCRGAGLATRYFYESFADRDALAIAVFDQVTGDIATTTESAVAAAPHDARARTHAGIANIVRTIATDPRQGHLLFSVALTSPPLVRRRFESARLFAGLLGGYAKDFYGVTESAALELMSQFIVGGLAQTLTAWLQGSLVLEQRFLVSHCTEIFLAIADHSLLWENTPNPAPG